MAQPAGFPYALTASSRDNTVSPYLLARLIHEA
jgi:hypothetical protein